MRASGPAAQAREGLPLPESATDPAARLGARTLVGISVLWIGLSSVGDVLTTVLLPQRVLEAPGSRAATGVGIVTFAALLLGALVQPVAGMLSDRARPRVGRIGAISAGVAAMLLLLAVFATASGIAVVALAYLALQVASNATQAAHQGFIPDLVPPRRRGLAAGLRSAMDLGGAFVGFALVASLASGGGTGPALLAIGGVLASTYVLTVVLVREPRPNPAGYAPRRSAASAFRVDLRAHRTFVLVVVSRFLFLFATFAVGRFLLLFVADRLDLGAAAAAERAAGLLAVLTGVTALGAPVGGWAADRFGRERTMAGGGALGAAGAALFVPAGSITTILLAGAVMALASAAFVPSNWALTADVVPHEEGARFFGLANLGTVGAAAIAGLLGPVIDLGNGMRPGAGYTVLFLVAAAAFAASGAVAGSIGRPLEMTGGSDGGG